MGRSRSKRRRSLRQKAGLVSLGALGVATAAVVGIAFQPTPPAQSSAVMDRSNEYAAKVKQDIETANAAHAASLLATVKRPVDRPLRFMVPGDSLSGGYYSSTEAKGFRSLVAASLGTHGSVEELKASQAGATLSTVGGLVGIPTGLDLAVIELGTNDTAGKTAAVTFAVQYDALLSTIRQGSPDVALVCVGPWGAPGAGTDPYDAAVEASCEKHGGQFVRISTVFAKAENRGVKGQPSWLGPADDFHPNDIGHQRIADLILERIKVV